LNDLNATISLIWIHLLQLLDTKRSKIPKFRISGQLESTVCKITEPFTGELCVEQCDAVIRSIELQLVRVETCGCAEGYARDGRYYSNRHSFVYWCWFDCHYNYILIDLLWLESHWNSEHTDWGGKCVSRSGYSYLYDISQTIHMSIAHN